MSEVDFEYEAKYRTEGHTFYITEGAVAENIPMAGTSEVTSNAYCGVRVVPEQGAVEDYEVFGRLGSTCIDLVSVNTGKEWEDVELPTILGSAHDEELMETIAKIIV